MSEALLALTGPALHDEVARCGAAAGYQIVRGDPARCRGEWLRATAVVVDGAALAVLEESGPPARPGVLVAAGPGADPTVWRAALSVGAQGGYTLPDDEAALVAALSALRRPRRSAAAVIALVGGHGGVGVSTFAAVLALTAGRADIGVLLLDVEPGGAGLDLLLGAEDAAGLRWSDITGETGSIQGQALSAALPRFGERVRILTQRRDDGASLSAETVLAVVDAARSDGGLVIADLGRATDPVAAGVLDSADLVVVLSSATVPAVAATRKLLARIGSRPELRLLVRVPAPGGLAPEQIARAVQVPLVGTLRTRAALARRCEEGGVRAVPRSPEVRAAAAVLAALTDVRGGRR